METQTEVIDPAARKEANRYFTIKMIANLIALILGAVLVNMLISQMQEKVALSKQSAGNDALLAEVVELIDSNAAIADELTDIYHRGNQKTLDVLSRVLDRGLFAQMADADLQTQCATMADLAQRSDVAYALVLDRDGTVLYSPVEAYVGCNLRTLGILSDRNVAVLLAGTETADGACTPVRESSPVGDFFFYSLVGTYDGTPYVLVGGADSAALDAQLASLTDVGTMLSGLALTNGGFFFAVDATTGCFVYYENEGTVLTGQDAAAHGLTAAALQDGYAGLQTIDGHEYYCVSRMTEGKMVISAVASTAIIQGNNNKVLAWSVGGYLLAMLLCLIYAVFVRNDFIVNKTETKTKRLFRLGRTEVFFDLSLAAKIAPLMVLAVLMVFGVTFYAQRMLAISDAVETSRVAVLEVASRYEDSVTTRDTVSKYYEDRYFAKARLLAFLLEEDSSSFDEESERQYTVYDENGVRSYVLDDEGNILTSVMNSAFLEEVRVDNGLSAIYIFDSAGHTIATSGDEWYYTISTDPADPSYGFRAVLDGKVDALATDLDGAVSDGFPQVFAVAFTYYTTLDENNVTWYVTRYDYERGTAPDNDNPVAAHRSMIQIRLQDDLIETLETTTDLDYVFSTDVLGSGFVVVFANDADHTLAYAPNEALVGKTATELGLGDNVFNGEYYGFDAINGVDYFVYCTYFDGWYIGTATPSAEVNRGCGMVALMSALISLVVILLLLLTVTLTTRREEDLYLAVAEEFRSLRDRPFFRAFAPGRNAGTTSAVARWDNSSLSWSLRTPEQKLVLLMEVLVGAVIFGVIAAWIITGGAMGGDELLRYVVSGTWDRGVNIFALTAVVLLFIVVMMGVQLVGIPVALVGDVLGTKAETVGHLLMSVVRYGSALVVLFYGLYLLGVDASGLLASLGILSLVVGFGAQSLIKDIIAGIFIVFEGDFRVGDIVTIGDFRGRVLDIGLRTTKIRGRGNNIKIINNSEISGVLNMTSQTSMVFVTVGVSYDTDIDLVEQVLDEELPKMENTIPGMIGVPRYLGVDELADSRVNLLFCADTPESEVYTVRRGVTRAILKALRQHGITIPFNMVTISNLHEAPEAVATAPEDDED